jgi:hypothetical protein
MHWIGMRHDSDASVIPQKIRLRVQVTLSSAAYRAMK